MAKFHYRLPPCPSYDIEGIESWLSDLAEKGLLLDGDGYVFGFMQFQRDIPRKVNYRLDAITHKSALFSILPQDPDPELLSFGEDCGWEYLGQFQDFYIYRSFDPNARELNTDPKVQAMALNSVKKRKLFYLILSIILLLCPLLGFLSSPAFLRETVNQQTLLHITRCLVAVGGIAIVFGAITGKKEIISKVSVFLVIAFFAATNYLFAVTTSPVLDILQNGWLWYILFAAFGICYLLRFAISYTYISLLQKHLANSGTLNRKKNWKKYRIARALFAAIPILLLLSLPYAQKHGRHLADAVPIEDFSRDLPFITIADLAPERTYTPVTHNGNNVVCCWSDILSPVNYDWNEHAYLDAPDGSRYAGSLSVSYHKTANVVIARQLTKEYAGSRHYDASLIPADMDTSGLDFFAVYDGIHPSVLIRRGTIVISAYCSVQSWDTHENLFPVWLEKMLPLLSSPQPAI